MKSTLRILALLVAFFMTTVAHGQFSLWDTATVKVSPDVFPIAGFEIYTLKLYDYNQDTQAYWRQRANLLKESGMNAIYQAVGWRDSSASKICGKLKGGMKGYAHHDLLMYDPGDGSGNFKDNSYLGYWTGDHGHDCSEMRFFLATNEDPETTYDTIRQWREKAGAMVPSLNEWKIEDDDPSDSDGYVLRNLDSYSDNTIANRFLEGPAGGGYFTVSKTARHAYCSFIYRLDSAQMSSITGAFTNNLFKIEYLLTLKNGNVVTVSDTGQQFISWSHYNTYNPATESENTNIVKFPSKDGARNIGLNIPSKNYAVLTKGIRILNDNGTFAYQNSEVVSIECRVKRLVAVPLYVRGLRIRSQLAHKILTNDAATISHLYDLIDAKVQQFHDSEWVNLLGFTGGNEPYVCDLRVWAKICSLSIHRQTSMPGGGVRKGKPIHVFISNNLLQINRYQWYRAIYEDETGEIAPPLTAENLEMVDIYPEPNAIPIDAVPVPLRNFSQFKKGGTKFFPVTGDKKKDFNSSFPDTTTVYTYDNYTTWWNGDSSSGNEASLRGHWRLFGWEGAAAGSYPPNKPFNKWSPFYAHIGTILSFVHTGEETQDTTHGRAKVVLPGVRARVVDSLRYHPGQVQCCNPNQLEFNYKDCIRGDQPPIPFYQGAVASEYRGIGWLSFAQGAKGLIFNVVGSDGGGQIGTSDYYHNHDKDYDTTGTYKNFINRFSIGSCLDPLIPPITAGDSMTNPVRMTHHVLRNWFTGCGGTNCGDADKCIIDILVPILTSGGTEITDSTAYYLANQAEFDAYLPGGKTWCLGDNWTFVRKTDPCGVAHKVATRKDFFTDGSGNNLQCPYWYSTFHYPQVSFNPVVITPTYFGFNERWSGAKRIIDDVTPIAKTLSELRWKSSVNFSTLSYHGSVPNVTKEKSKAVFDWVSYPIKDVISEKAVANDTVLHFSGTDDSATAFLQFGLFNHPTDSAARYIVVANMRTWPVYYTAGGAIDTSNGKLGAKDIRRVSIRFDGRKIDSNYTLLSITNLRTKKDTMIHTDSLYTLVFQPGEGTLIRVAPAVGLGLGKMTSNLYNNGRHIYPVEDAVGNVAQYATTYENNGSIVVSYPDETPVGFPSKRKVGTPKDSIIVVDTCSYNPAIAFNKQTNAIGLVYQKIRRGTGTNNDTICIFYRRARYGAQKYIFSTAIRIDSFIAQKGYISPPAIAPKNTASDIKEFWVGYNHPTLGGAICMVDSTVARQGAQFVYKTTRAHVEFVSLATHVPWDTVEIAFQEGTSDNSKICYAQGYMNNGQMKVTTPTNVKVISDFNLSCKSRHPQITIDDRKVVSVTYEAYKQKCTPQGADHPCGKRTYKNYVVYRQKNAKGWGFHTTYLGVTAQRDSADIYFPTAYPNIITGDSTGYIFGPPPEWNDILRLAWNNEETERVQLFRLGRAKGRGTAADGYTMIEPSLEPALPTYAIGKHILEPVLYRSPQDEGSNNRSARITQYDFPKVGVTPNVLEGIIIDPSPYVACLPGGGIGKVGDVKVSDDLDTIINDIGFFTSNNDTTGSGLADSSLTWNDKRLRTKNFTISSNQTLSYYRHFSVGNFEAGDVAELASYLSDSSAFIGIRIYLRKSSNDSILRILDTCQLQKDVFTHSLKISEFGRANIPFTTGFADSVYMSMEAFEQGAQSDFAISQLEMYNEPLFPDPELPADNVAYKSAPESQTPVTNGQIEEKLTLTVNPNPFESGTKVTVQTYKDIPLVIEVYNVLGGVVSSLYNGMSSQEHYEFTLDNRTIRPGAYFIRAKAGNAILTRKIQFIK